MIVLITPTGARKDQFELCAKYMKRQDYKGSVVWIIVDDFVPLTTNIVQPDFKEDWEIVKVYPVPIWSGINTQSRNIKVGIDTACNNYNLKDIEAFFIIEDDDYYKPDYLFRMMNHKGNYWAFGETRTIYYNVAWRRFLINANTAHASLFQTAFTPEALPAFQSSYGHKFIDAYFWQIVNNKYLFYDNVLSIGIKGMPGRGGIGAGHKPGMSMTNDIEMRYLYKIIGKEDAKAYEKYYGHYGQLRNSRFITKSR